MQPEPHWLHLCCLQVLGAVFSLTQGGAHHVGNELLLVGWMGPCEALHERLKYSRIVIIRERIDHL